MARGVKHYSRKLRRQANNETTARLILVEENCDGIHVVISEVGPTRDKDGYTTGYHLHSVSWKRYLTLEEAISAAEIALQHSLDSGFYEVAAEISARR
jgi:hypothetical protein